MNVDIKNIMKLYEATSADDDEVVVDSPLQRGLVPAGTAVYAINSVSDIVKIFSGKQGPHVGVSNSYIEYKDIVYKYVTRDITSIEAYERNVLGSREMDAQDTPVKNSDLVNVFLFRKPGIASGTTPRGPPLSIMLQHVGTTAHNRADGKGDMVTDIVIIRDSEGIDHAYNHNATKVSGASMNFIHVDIFNNIKTLYRHLDELYVRGNPSARTAEPEMESGSWHDLPPRVFYRGVMYYSSKDHHRLPDPTGIATGHYHLTHGHAGVEDKYASKLDDQYYLVSNTEPTYRLTYNPREQHIYHEEIDPAGPGGIRGPASTGDGKLIAMYNAR